MVAPAVFFFTGFNVIVLTTNLVLADYFLSAGNFMLATVAALVVAKAVLVANAVPALRRYDQAPLIRSILFKAVVYWAIVTLVRLLEHLIEFTLVDHNSITTFVPHMIAAFSWHRFTAIQIWILVLFLIYVTAAEFGRLLGKKRVLAMLFDHPSPQPPPAE